MTKPDCLALQQAVFEAGDGPALLERRPDLAAHHHDCAGCRAWLAAFVRGAEAAADDRAFAAGVLARTVDNTCAQARTMSAAALDEPLPATERTLVATHLASCHDCRAVVDEMTASVAALRELADIDPGQAFTASVLLATSLRPSPVRALDRWRGQWDALVHRPRFAIEAAYALTLCLVLVTGNPLWALEWTAARVEPLVQRAGAPVEALDARVQALRERMAGDSITASGVTLGPGPAWTAWARQVRDDVVRSVAAGLTGIVEALEAAVSWVERWAIALLARVQPVATEPDAGAARSPQ